MMTQVKSIITIIMDTDKMIGRHNKNSMHSKFIHMDQVKFYYFDNCY